MHPYYHWPTTVGSVVDLLAIGEIMLNGLAAEADGDLYLTGFSQGGGATAAVQRALERQNPTGLRLRAAAPIAGAFNLREIGLQNAIENDDRINLGYLLAAFADTYGQPLNGLVREPYVGRLAEWFDGTKDGDFLRDHLPEHVDELLTPEFLRDFRAGIEEPPWFYAGLHATTLDDYTPSAPLRLYFGSTDTIVTPEESRSAFARMRERGGNVTLVDAGPYGHDDLAVRALPAVQRWFDAVEESTE